MNHATLDSTLDKLAWLRPMNSDFGYEAARTHLLLAINDADEMGFWATKEALIALLRELQTSIVTIC